MASYNYTKIANLDILENEIKNSSITIALSGITLENTDDLTVTFKASLSASEETTLDGLVSSHDGSQITPPEIEIDEDGRQITKHAATYRGWHYQAHSVQFEVNKLGSVYNKDRDGNDLGFTTMKVYDATGVELTTQADVDLYGVKTVCKWAPNFDLDIISGNVRQATKESIDSYIYVDAVVPTGYPAPYDKLYVPFTTGGINLKYIGADEQLKTDGRAGKTIKCSEGAYFEITVNYEASVLTNENRHELSVIFEIYKDPTV